METIRVNMTPCEDVQTIHASQNDNEAREWGFELHNNGEKIDSSSISDQMVFKAYEGGTEQILPENGSTPATSPFFGDIRYPQGLLSGQEFLYRQSPAEEDGLAWIKNIKGNTLIWNQLVQNGNFADTSVWQTVSGASFTVSGNVANVTSTSAYGRIRQFINFISGHKYLIFADVKKSNANDGIRLYYGTQLGGGSYIFENNTNWQKLAIIKTATSSESSEYPNVEPTADNITWQQRNMMIIDLTQMGLDSITDPSEFTSLFSLPYYDYNQGTLLSFNGNGIKTTGKNEANIPFEQGAVSQTVNFSYQASKVSSATRIRCESLVVAEKNKIYKCNWNTSIYDCVVQAYGENRLSTGASDNPFNTWFTVPFTFTGTGYVAIAFKRKDGANITPSEIDSIRPNLYLADTESITNLPISTYFPSGMKSAGNVYDELTSKKAITRIGAVDLGTLAFSQSSNFYYRQNSQDLGIKADAAVSFIAVDSNITSVYYYGNSGQFRVYVNDISIVPSGTLYYELATPTETSFTTASLVTENAEIPLSNEDGVLIGKCTEQLSSESGFFDAKIKLADEDGECYSNKIQLHVERSPQ